MTAGEDGGKVADNDAEDLSAHLESVSLASDAGIHDVAEDVGTVTPPPSSLDSEAVVHGLPLRVVVDAGVQCRPDTVDRDTAITEYSMVSLVIHRLYFYTAR